MRLLKQKRIFVLILSLVSINAYSYPKIPDVNQTPGSICSEVDPDFSEYRYGENIPYCRRDVATDLKTQIYINYHVPLECRNRYTIDHLIPLSVGGNNSIENLWPEHKKVKETRANFEYNLYLDLKAGRITQQEAVDRVYEVKFTEVAFIDRSHCDLMSEED